MSKAKWKKGRRIRSLDSLMKQDRIWWKPYYKVERNIVSKGWFVSWQLRFAAHQVEIGNCFIAVPNRGARAVKKMQ